VPASDLVPVPEKRGAAEDEDVLESSNAEELMLGGADEGAAGSATTDGGSPGAAPRRQSSTLTEALAAAEMGCAHPAILQDQVWTAWQCSERSDKTS
jgi:hypothetical protein